MHGEATNANGQSPPLQLTLSLGEQQSKAPSRNVSEKPSRILKAIERAEREPTPRMHPINFLVPPGIFAVLREIGAREEIPPAQVARNILVAWVMEVEDRFNAARQAEKEQSASES